MLQAMFSDVRTFEMFLVSFKVFFSHFLRIKTMNRQFGFYMKHKTAMKNNFIGILDQTYPGVNTGIVNNSSVKTRKEFSKPL